MAVSPVVGRAGGQEYDVARAIRTFLEQMAGGGGFSFGAAVIKELIQNADDAGATELVVALDERSSEQFPSDCGGYAPLLEPALLVRNDAAFRIAGDGGPDGEDDFKAICEVAVGHKAQNPTAAGRFGIGFNSVYFLTDTPVIFSRREVHLFDLRHLMFERQNGWRFSLDEFPAAAANAGPIKTVLDCIFPKAILGEAAFHELAGDGTDYQRTVFRLPLRRTIEAESVGRRGSVFPNASFPNADDREVLLREMCEEAGRSLLFLKSLRRVVFGEIAEKRFQEWARVEASLQAPEDWNRFVADLTHMRELWVRPDSISCSFRCDVSILAVSPRIGVTSRSSAFLVTHSAGTRNQELLDLAERLRKNGERAVPWVGIATPLDVKTFDWEGGGNAHWRVFLPLLEEGPCAAVLNAALFVDPSRRAVEFRTDGSDATLRKSKWNRLLAEQCLVPLLREVSAAVLDHAPELVWKEPKRYLSLFPITAQSGDQPTNLADVVRASFSGDVWLLRLNDLWGEAFEVWVGADAPTLKLESIPEWIARYSGEFRDLSSETRRFVLRTVGDALRERLGECRNIEVCGASSDLADRILLSRSTPRPGDLTRLLRLLDNGTLGATALIGRWAFQRAEADHLLRFDADTLYLVRTSQVPDVYEAFRSLTLTFERAEWVTAEIGLCALRSNLARDLQNTVDADEAGALELLRRVGRGNAHDFLSDHRKAGPIIDFLLSQSPLRLTDDLRLAFLVKTAPAKLDRRPFGVMLLRPENPTPDEEDLWQGLLREAFAEVDPQFAPSLRRLLEHAPQLAASLGTDTCEVRIARGYLLEALHRARMQDASFFGKLRERLGGEFRAKGKCRSEVYRAARLILEEAATRWDSLDRSVQRTVLVLPIHRTSTGEMISLLAEGDPDATDGLGERYCLQSDDDLRDAPLELPQGRLLYSLDPGIRAFYRRGLGIRNHGRVEMLKECLRQIGVDPSRSEGILLYLAKHYADTIARLRDGSAEDLHDDRQLEQLHRLALGVPCLDGTWRRASECLDASDASKLLERQDWQGPRLSALLCRLNYPRPVAAATFEAARSSLQLWTPETLDREAIPALAITSQSPDLPFADRVRVIADNLGLLQKSAPKRATILDEVPCHSSAGETPLGSLLIVDARQLGLSDAVIEALVPEAADLSRIAAEFTGGSARAAVGVLRALGVKRFESSDLLARLKIDFAGVWGRLDREARIELLQWIAASRDDVAIGSSSLATVLVAGEGNEWRPPSDLIAPRWARLLPPNVPKNSMARIEGIPEEVLALWNRWCGVRELGPVVQRVVEATGRLPRTEWRDASQRLTEWLERVARDNGAQELATALHPLPWVLARRGEEFEFCRPEDVVVHAGGEVLQRRFWVAQAQFPPSLAGAIRTHRLSGTPDTLTSLADCLRSSTGCRPEHVESVYELAVELTRDDEVALTSWRALAWEIPVYRLFRDGDRVVSGNQLFLGDREQNTDFGAVLFCFTSKAQANPERHLRVRQFYRSLGVELRPTFAQLTSALAGISGESKAIESVHSALVDALVETDIERVTLDPGVLRLLTIRSCAKTYEPLARCYRDSELDRPSRLAIESRSRMIDGRDSANRKLLRWLDDHQPGVVTELRSVATPELVRQPSPAAAGIASDVLDAWRDWLGELAMPGSLVRETVEKLGFAVPTDRIVVEIVAKIEVCFRLDDGSVVPAEDWTGIEVFAPDRLLVRSDIVARDFVGQASEVEALDEKITAQVEDLLRRRARSANQSAAVAGSLRDAVHDTLERPATVLKRMKTEKEGHFFHQYFDQAADPEFSNLFDQYRRTSRAATEKLSQLTRKMWELITERFVDSRREQIRGYGYDEFAVFAELIQNAEDAYAQRRPLAMPEPSSRGIRFRYTPHADGTETLTVEHYGRPFNVWRHGSVQIPEYRLDVEGVLKSAGSFKPHSAHAGAQPIGRFGLGFKSVYLVTNSPHIHSGDWHFEIRAACIPEELPVPDDYPKEATRIVLPLSADSRERLEGTARRFAQLLPFLREINELHVGDGQGGSHSLNLEKRKLLATAAGTVEVVKIHGVTDAPGEVIRLLRLRHADHDGQLGVLLAVDDLPVAWDDALDADAYAFLPLRVRLGCGVAVSHRFEVQSGRTHLIDPAANAPRVAEVASLLRALPGALMAEAANVTEAMSRFWLLWRWDKGDDEASALRTELARELARLACTAAVVPTLEAGVCVRLGETPVFAFDGIPYELVNELLDREFEVIVDDRKTVVRRNNVIPEKIRAAYERACAVARDGKAATICSIGWEKLGKLFVDSRLLTEHPWLVSTMARSLAPGQLDDVGKWLSQCRFRSAKGGQLRASELLPPRFPGAHHLPDRLFDRLDDAYDDDAVSLLKRADLPSLPALGAIETWIQSGLDQRECRGLLTYLAEAGRWRRHYYNLGPLLRAAWFAAEGDQLTTAEAFERGLLPADLDSDPAFRAWLGVGGGIISIPPETVPAVRPSADPQKTLMAIHKWWESERDALVGRYEERTYPDAQAPKLDRVFSDRDSLHRQGWLSLLILASLQTMGRTTPEQHREFLGKCRKLGWMNVFSDHPPSPDRWIGVLENYMEGQADDIAFYHWVRQFVSIYQIARWLPEYVESFLAIDKFAKRFDLDHVLKPATSPTFSGGGPSAPPLTRALGIGSCFLVRELVRTGVVRSQHAHEHCFVPVGRVRAVLARVGLAELQSETASYRQSPRIYALLCNYLGPERAHFGRCFDLPFLQIAESHELQARFLDCELPDEYDDTT